MVKGRKSERKNGRAGRRISVYLNMEQIQEKWDGKSRRFISFFLTRPVKENITYKYDKLVNVSRKWKLKILRHILRQVFDKGDRKLDMTANFPQLTDASNSNLYNLSITVRLGYNEIGGTKKKTFPIFEVRFTCFANKVPHNEHVCLSYLFTCVLR